MLSYSQSCKRISERLMSLMTGRKATESSRKLRQGKLLVIKNDLRYIYLAYFKRQPTYSQGLIVEEDFFHNCGKDFTSKKISHAQQKYRGNKKIRNQ